MRALFSQEELAQIPENELRFLDKISSKEQIIYKAATLDQNNVPHLFDLYATKFGFSEEMLKSKHGIYKDYSLLHIAASLNSLKAIDVILSTEIGRDLMLVQTPHSRDTPLSPVVVCGFNEALIKLLSTTQGKQALYLPDGVGAYPIHQAAFMDKTVAFDIIIRRFNEIGTLHLRDSNGFLPIHEATVWHRPKFISEILKYDEGLLTLSQANNDGDLAVHLAARQTIEELSLLIDTPYKRSFLHVQNMDGDTPLHIAASRYGWYENIAKILEYPEGRACLKIKNKTGCNLLEVAIWSENVRMIEEIIKHKEGRALIPYLSSTDDSLVALRIRNNSKICTILQRVMLADKLIANITPYELTDSEMEVASGLRFSLYIGPVKMAIRSHLLKYGIDSQYQGVNGLECNLSRRYVLVKLGEEVSRVIEAIYNNFVPMMKLASKDNQGSISI